MEYLFSSLQNPGTIEREASVPSFPWPLVEPKVASTLEAGCCV